MTDRDPIFVDTLDTILTSVTDLLGFEVASISLVNASGMMETVAVAGDEQARSALMGHLVEVDQVAEELLKAEHWGPLRFISHDKLEIPPEELAWVPVNLEASDDPNRWHPYDLLVAPLYDSEEQLRALISVDSPVDGLRPAGARLSELEKFIIQTRPAVLNVIERAELAAQVRLADAARLVVREASSELSIERILEVTQTAVTRCFDAFGMWIQAFDQDGEGQNIVHASNGADIRLTDELRRIARVAARMMWDLQDVGVLADTLPSVGVLTSEQEEAIFSFMRTIGVTSMLFIPLGAGKECLGNLVLTRRGGRINWSETEKRVALDIGHDLGRALLNARSFERERRLVEELRELDSYKSNLIATLSHELKNPLTSILGHAEMLEATPELSRSARNSVSSVERGAARMQRIIEDLLTLAHAGDPHAPFAPVAVDLRASVLDTIDMLRVTINRKNLQVDVDASDEAFKVFAEPEGIDRILANLISNAAKYTAEGGKITVSLRQGPRNVRLDVSDTGLGISEIDQANLFNEFFRSTNPAAVALPGTGLGLAIVKRIVERHNGRITFESQLGKGTTFSVVLPRN
ncbi:sensor histidine kinase [Nocardioides gilvus]|uniref:sensor histidine kinase n=1 Tax=Nocardioides gilvus TaxID=1735589 RepID=UPI001EF6E6E5|nr:HAMP domain-containing sensor histidine kinase [Nocardioides gilvus]